jgi:hypothetical protein
VPKALRPRVEKRRSLSGLAEHARLRKARLAAGPAAVEGTWQNGTEALRAEVVVSRASQLQRDGDGKVRSIQHSWLSMHESSYAPIADENRPSCTEQICDVNGIEPNHIEQTAHDEDQCMEHMTQASDVAEFAGQFHGLFISEQSERSKLLRPISPLCPSLT